MRQPARLLHRTPLRVKLVAAMLALVAAALIVISVVSAVALRSYLINQVDHQLEDTIVRVVTGELPVTADTGQPVLPSETLLMWRAADGTGSFLTYDQRYGGEELPPLPTDHDAAAAMVGGPRTVDAADGIGRWRMKVTQFEDGSVLLVAQRIAAVDRTVSRLIWVEVFVGLAVVIVTGGIGGALVRKSLRPLLGIERTAAAIAAGDLTRRVPEQEPPDEPPQSELGQLGRALNMMLAQIESAFTDRTRSEAAARAAEGTARAAAGAARAAEGVARAAALAAQESESRARSSEERMRRFIADASHELRTPLTTIRGFAELYRQGAVTSAADVSRLVRRIEDEASRMGLLVQDLLLLARLDRERPLDLAPVELPVIAADAVHAARAIAPDRDITLTTDGGSQLVVAGDDARLRQVIGNLVTNALTHTPAGSPVAVRLRSEPPTAAAPAGSAVLEVADQGPGLDPEQAERVFERFYRVDSARTRPAARAPNDGDGDGVIGDSGGAVQGGTGLGLAIVAALVAAHRGTVEVDSEPGAGATFRVRVPLLAGESAGGDVPAGEAAGGGPTVDSQPVPRPVED